MKLKTPAFVLFAVVALIGLGAYSQLGHEKHRRYPLIDDIVSDYPQYAGTKVAIWGRVVETGAGVIKVASDRDDPAIVFFLLTDAVAGIGNNAEALGTLGQDYRVSVEEIIVHEPWKEDLILVRSAVAIPLILFVFFRSCKFDRKTKRFIERQ